MSSQDAILVSRITNTLRSKKNNPFRQVVVGVIQRLRRENGKDEDFTLEKVVDTLRTLSKTCEWFIQEIERENGDWGEVSLRFGRKGQNGTSGVEVVRAGQAIGFIDPTEKGLDIATGPIREGAIRQQQRNGLTHIQIDLKLD